MHLSGAKVQGAPTKMIATVICDRDAHKAMQRRHNRAKSWSFLGHSRRDKADDLEDGDDSKDEDLGSETSEPEFVKYGAESIPGDKSNNINYVLRLRWKTVHACEDQAGQGGRGSSSHWGFFTWFIIMLVLQPGWDHLMVHADNAPVCSSSSRPTSFLDLGSTTIDTGLVGGIYCRMVTRSETSRTCSKTGVGRLLTRCRERILGVVTIKYKDSRPARVLLSIV